jgi:RNA recognition motif-containing protein
MANKIYVSGLSRDIVAEDLTILFNQVGTVESAVVIAGKHSGRSRVSGYVEMSTDGEAQQAIARLNGETLGQQVITVEVSPSAPGAGKTPQQAVAAGDGAQRW